MAPLTVKVIEEITLNNNSYNSERSLDISSVNEIAKRIVTISTTETGLLGFATTSATDLSKNLSWILLRFTSDIFLDLGFKNFATPIPNVLSVII